MSITTMARMRYGVLKDFNEARIKMLKLPRMRKGAAAHRLLANTLTLLLVMSSFMPYGAWGWNKDKEWLERYIAGDAPEPGKIDPKSYLGKVSKKVQQKWDSNHDNKPDDPGSAELTKTGGLGSRKYWQGDPDPLKIAELHAQAALDYTKDMVTNFSADFNGCVAPDFEVDYLGLKAELELWWPVYQVHTHPTFQNRYGNIFDLLQQLALIFDLQLFPTYLGFPIQYPLLYGVDAHAWAPYGHPNFPLPSVSPYFYFRYGIQPMMMGHAKYQMQKDLLQKWGPLAAALTAAGHDVSWIFPDWALYAAPAIFPSLRYNPLNPYNYKFLKTATSDQLKGLKLDKFAPILLDSTSAVNGSGMPDCAGDKLNDLKCRELRYATTPVSGRHPLDFSVLPSLFSIIWQYVPAIASVLYLLPPGCRPPRKLTYPWDSDRMEMFYQTRDPFLGMMTFTNDKEYQKDYTTWLENPKVCTEYKMANGAKYSNIPYDQFDSKIALPLLPDIDLPDLLTAQKPKQAKKYDRMCTANVGSNVPFTINNSPQGIEILAALTNIEKASRLSYAYYKQFIEGKAQFDSLYTFRMINEKNDKIQFTYHDGVPQKCFKFGDIGEMETLFKGGDAMVKKGDYGLYNATVWQKSSCTIPLAMLIPIFAALIGLVPTIAGLVIFG